MSEQVFTNAAIVLPDEIVHGSLLVRDGRIADISAGSTATGHDCEGDILLPGLVELHTDHLEGHYSPRPGVHWNMLGAVQAHDGQIATSGITTVFDCLRMGSDEDGGFDPTEMRRLADAIEHANRDGRLRAEHRLHLRCEVSAPDVLDALDQFRDDPNVSLASLMDHAPGQRQFQSMEQYTLYYKTKRGLSDAAFQAFIDRRLQQSATYSARHRQAIVEHCRARGITLASHDDATLAHVEEAVSEGVAVSEFPTSLEAARAAHGAGLSVLMGAPNVVRGGSHSGNVSAATLVEDGVLDILSSDYVPFSLMQAIFLLSDRIGLPRAARTVTQTPARAANLTDRGAIELGLRADLVHARAPARTGEPPVVRGVWREGRRVA
ncbi:alpha-D-ribose 1-methylphosphonate 5-triphosphate diphosphatase [Aureimonas jatrophae]|uniref:Alpha-D-ribose 1-methylphosphonate 5-triphosphate diphosphatase n=1 Tax=Aureimonas jatrophae TaxID=1166073 RepID=A0A1H0C6X7_9HYPH|nr:alpha-D-ribose 1-methylphosphonate 5-triphosphate diphosphatase [Aureimonas jatrophae]MBB3949093.1 alpha-D-ribose 1-methylphosphonate 5-triphosphate diphosphatase [Aureimonas jatrophae]SDN53586.1 alpha-D-ribose 1-methylphosphonate 5-triphosphate diphosphatase [Aureimonas jatrophae]